MISTHTYMLYPPLKMSLILSQCKIIQNIWFVAPPRGVCVFACVFERGR